MRNFRLTDSRNSFNNFVLLLKITFMTHEHKKKKNTHIILGNTITKTFKYTHKIINRIKIVINLCPRFNTSRKNTLYIFRYFKR